MADNTQLATAAGGDTIRTLDKSGSGAPKTEVVALDLGGGDGRSEFIATAPLPIALDGPVDDDGVPLWSLSPSSMDALEMLFRQTIAASGYQRTAAEIAALVVPVNTGYLPGDVRRYGAVGDGVTDDSVAFANAALVSNTYPMTLVHQTFVVNTPFVLPTGGAIFTTSRKAIIKTTIPGNHIVSSVGTNNITLYSINFQGANSYTHPLYSIGGFQSNQTGLATFVNCTNIRIYDCEFSSFCNGVSAIQCNKAFVTHSYIHNWLIYGILGSLSTEASFDFNVMDTCDLAAIPTFTGAPAANAVSATLNANWGYASGTYGVLFIETSGGQVEVRGVTLTNGATTATWTGGLTAACNAQTNGSCYGISITGNEVGAVPAKGISASFNRIWNVPAWDGIMSHDINGFTVIGNDIRNVRTGIDVTYSTANTFVRNASISNNTVEATTQDLWNGVSGGSAGIWLNGFPFAITFTGAPASSATSATLNANWTYQSGAYTVQFTETAGGLLELRQVTLTNGASTATWTTGLSANCNAGASATFTAETVTVTGNMLRNFGNMATSSGYGAPVIGTAGVIALGYVNDVTVTGNILEGTGSVGGYVGVYFFGTLNNGTVLGNILNGNHSGGAIRSVGLVALNLVIDGNTINQTVTSNYGIQLGNTSQIALLSVGTNPSNSLTPIFNETSALTLVPTGVPVIQSYLQSSFLVPTGTVAALSKNLRLGGASRATLQGTARLRIN